MMAAKGESSPRSVDKVEQWISRVTRFSSQYDASGWSANCVIGQPQVYPRYGDLHGAWAQGVCDSEQFIEVGFEHKIYIEDIHIYETYHAGSVRCIRAKGQGDKWVTIWTAEETEDLHISRIFMPPIMKTAFKTDELRIETDCSTSGTWTEIDAVKIIGKKFNFSTPAPVYNLADDLGKLVNSPKFSDVQFLVGKETFYGHKAILTVRSEYFNVIFNSDYKEKTSKDPIRFEDISADAFMAMLHFVYTNKIPADCYSCLLLAEVWRVADLFNLVGLQSLTIREMTSKLHVHNVVDVYMEAISKLPVIGDIQAVCTEFMRCNMSEVVRMENFMTLPQENVIELIQLMTSELNI